MTVSPALLDACSLYPQVLRQTLLGAAAAGLFQARWSPGIWAEVRRHWLKHGRMSVGAAIELEASLRARFPEAWVEPSPALVAEMTNPRWDRHVLAAAVAAQARCLVTANVKDFPPRSVGGYAIEVLSPAAFLTRLFRRDPEGMMQVLTGQVALLRPQPSSLPALLACLQTTAPKFARTVKAYLAAP